MPFLALNGVTVPTAQGGGVEYVEVGARDRAISGGYITDVRALKRRWRYQTVPVSEFRSLALIGILQGQGFYLAGDNGTTDASNGRAANSGVINTRDYYAADGAPSLDERGVPDARYATAAARSYVSEPGAATNLLPVGVATGASLDGAESFSSTLTIDTDNKWEGTSSICVTGDGFSGSPGIQYSPLFTGALGTSYAVSFYVKNAGTPADISARLSDTANESGTSTVVFSAFLTADMGWRRFSTAYVTPSSGATPRLRLLLTATPAEGVDAKFYLDGIQIEINPAGAFPRLFAAPGTTRAASNLNFIDQPHGPGGMTFNYWVTQPYIANATAMHVQAINSTPPTKSVSVFTPAGSTTMLRFVTGSPFNAVDVPVTYAYTGWHMITAVVRYNPEGSEVSKYLYFDGELKGSANHTVAGGLPAYGDRFTNFYIGRADIGSYAYVRMADVQVLPFPVEQAAVSGWFNDGAGGTLGAAPLIKATGEFSGDTSVTVAGSVERLSTVGYSDDGVWRNNGRVIEFTLEEI